MPRVLSVVLLVSACVLPSAFPFQVARRGCERLQACVEASFVGLFADESTCLDAMSGVMVCFARHCAAFDSPAARDCLDAVEEAPCDALVDPTTDATCVAAWSQCEDDDLAACLAAEGASVFFGGPPR